MLAYVFWHWRQAAVDREEYERVLGGFHASLRDAPSPGFRRSWVWRVQGAPWLPEGTGYEDWYLLDGSAALDPLNEAAVTASRQRAHDQAARLVAGGTAGLYRLRVGEPSSAATRALWFGKPTGVAYADFYATLERATAGRPFTLWTRQMVLGAAPEFCLQGQGTVSLPVGASLDVVSLSRVWS